MRSTTFIALLACLTASAQTRDGGANTLSAAECSELMEHIVLISVDQSLAEDPEVKKMTPKEREVTERLARREALADPKLIELKKDCPQRYDKKSAQCMKKARTIKDVDACTQ